MASDNELPPRCLRNCPVITSDKLDDYPLFPTRNCRGPVVRSKEVSEKIYVSRDGSVEVEVPDSSHDESDLLIIHASEDTVTIETSQIGRFVCRNEGINVSLDALIQAVS